MRSRALIALDDPDALGQPMVANCVLKTWCRFEKEDIENIGGVLKKGTGTLAAVPWQRVSWFIESQSPFSTLAGFELLNGVRKSRFSRQKSPLSTRLKSLLLLAWA